MFLVMFQQSTHQAEYSFDAVLRAKIKTAVLEMFLVKDPQESVIFFQHGNVSIDFHC